jgi:pectate lyase
LLGKKMPALCSKIGYETASSQQTWLRTLAALTVLTGDARYRDQAAATTRAAFARLSTPEGLLYWGGHLAYDLERDEAWMVEKYGHEMKGHFPYYWGMHEVDPTRTQRLQEAIWLYHINDWSTLLFNRHAAVTPPGKKGKSAQQPLANWAYPFEAAPALPLRPKTSELSFANAATSLIYTAFQHAAQTGQDDLVDWSMRLIGRYWAMQHPDTGLGGFQFNVRKQGKVGDKAQTQYADILGDEAREWLLLPARGFRQTTFQIVLLLCADSLPVEHPARAVLIDRAVAEWVSYYRYAWDTHKQQWYAITTSGRRLPFEKMQQTKGYYSARKWDPQPTNGTVLWLAALAARLKPSVETQRILASQLEAMKLGRLSNGKALLAETTDTMDERVIYALLEM